MWASPIEGEEIPARLPLSTVRWRGASGDSERGRPVVKCPRLCIRRACQTSARADQDVDDAQIAEVKPTAFRQLQADIRR
jgi:hypothetical protein